MEGTDRQGNTARGGALRTCTTYDWFQNHWRKRMAGGDTITVRYADDFVCGFQHLGDARR